MIEPYDFKSSEPRWQERWAEEGTYEIELDDPRSPYYVLCMYPYPSGPAHQGHVRNYTFGDVLVRMRTMQGYGVLSPFGFDSFGLPAENAAIKGGAHRRAQGERDAPRRRLRLAPRGSQPRPRVHEVQPDDLHPPPRGGPRLS